MKRYVTLLVSALFVLSLGCSDDSGNQDNNGTSNNNSMTNNGTNNDSNNEPEFMCPNEGELVCDNRCINVTFNMDNCGECGNSCAVGSQTCDGGACQCLGDNTLCGNRCFDTSSNREHCGTCDNECDISEACVDSNCILVSDRSEVTGVLQETNTVRSSSQDCGEHGPKSAVGGLQLNDELMIAAQGHAEDMAENNFMAHEGSDGSSPGQRADRANYTGGSVGENVARGYRTPEAVVQGWLDSDGHCNNMMNGSYNEIGIGYAVSNGGEAFWVQLFGRR